MMPLRETSLITELKGIGATSAKAFHTIGVDCIRDLFMHLPLNYDSYVAPQFIEEVPVGGIVTVKATLTADSKIFRKGHFSVVNASATDGRTRFRLSWFNMPYLAASFKSGKTAIFRGKLSYNDYGYFIEQPAVFAPDEYESMLGSLQPVYRSASGLSGMKIRKCVGQALENTVLDKDFIPEDLRLKYKLMDRAEAIKAIHFPVSREEMMKARRRFVFEEFLLFIMSIRIMSTHSGRVSRYRISKSNDAERLINELPYKLTGAQSRVLDEVMKDMGSGLVMNRLVQGDVGSGKTILALLALISTAQAGFQGVLMAPTEVLAAQHYENVTGLFAGHNIPFRVCLLTGSMTAAEKKKIHAAIKAHEYDIIIGTHAVISKGVEYDKLALVITDEQHRFGVRQREALSDKGDDPHVIVMSATPIPRTLAIIIYGDLDISVVDELPASRLPIKNCVVGPEFRKKSYAHILKELQAGHQAYIICPKVEESEGEGTGENVIDYAQKVRAELPPAYRVEYLHGRMKPADKNRVMEEFAAGRIQVLVSTTVVEVGVDVANATVMMIEDAQSFGLATLHQLRGRVGRGKDQSYCIFINSSGDAAKAERLSILKESNDGFVIAGKDLESRGPGDAFGIRQSGAVNFAVGDIFTDSRVLQEASEAADKMLSEIDNYPALKDKIKAYSDSGLNL